MTIKQFKSILKHFAFLAIGPSLISVKRYFKVFRTISIFLYTIILTTALYLTHNTNYLSPSYLPALFLIMTFLLFIFTSTITTVVLSSLVITFFAIFPITFQGILTNIWLTTILLIVSWELTKNSYIYQKNLKLKYKMKLKDKNDMTYKIFSNLSHELRNPLSVISGFAEFLIPWAEKKGFSQETYYLKMIKRNGHILLNVLNSILEFSKIESDHYEINKTFINLHKILSEIVKEYREEVDTKGLHLKFTSDTTSKKELFLDETAITQIIYHLLDNAIKYTQEGTISIEIQILNDKTLDKDELLISIEDTGTGISENAKQDLFKPFNQLGSRLSEIDHGGIGLGLPIVHRIIEKMDGEIHISSDFKGTKVDLKIPTFIGENIHSLHINETHKLNKKFNIITGEKETVLVVEDMRDNRYLLRKLLKSLKFNVIEARNGKEAIDIINHQNIEHPISAIFMDMQMPILNGFQATKILRRKGYNRPIIALTAKNMQGDKEACFKSGCNDYLPKPFKIKTLKNVAGKIAKHQY